MSLLAEGYAPLDEERGNVLPDGVENFPILAQHATIDFLANFVIHSIDQIAGLDALIQVGDQFRPSGLERLMRFGTTDEYEKFFVHF